MILDDVHWSGKFKASPKQWQAAVGTVAEAATLAAFTEARGTTLSVPGWQQFLPPHSAGTDCTILWDETSWRLAGPKSDATGWVTLTSKAWPTRSGVVAPYVLLEDPDTRRTLLRLAAHFPAGVQTGDAFAKAPARVGAWVAATRALATVIRDLQHELRPDETTLSADWNVNLARAHWRGYINHALKGTGMRLVVPTHPTHGTRTIDGHATTLTVPTFRADGFDHIGALATLTSKES